MYSIVNAGPAALTQQPLDALSPPRYPTITPRPSSAVHCQLIAYLARLECRMWSCPVAARARQHNCREAERHALALCSQRRPLDLREKRQCAAPCGETGRQDRAAAGVGFPAPRQLPPCRCGPGRILKRALLLLSTLMLANDNGKWFSGDQLRDDHVTQGARQVSEIRRDQEAPHGVGRTAGKGWAPQDATHGSPVPTRLRSRWLDTATVLTVHPCGHAPSPEVLSAYAVTNAPMQWHRRGV